MVKANVKRKGITPVIAIVLLLMMTVAAAGLAYEFIMNMSEKQTEAIGEQVEAQSSKMRTEFRIIQVKSGGAGDLDYYIKNVGSLEIPEFDGTKLSVKQDGDLRFDATFAGTCTSAGTIEVGDVCVLSVSSAGDPLSLPGDAVTTVSYELILDSGITVSYACNLADAADTFC